MKAIASMTAPAKGIGLMLIGGLVLTMSDTATKWLTGSYPVGQIMAIRALFTLIPITLFVWQNGGLRSLRIGNFKMQFLRAACAVASSFLFVWGLVHLPLADAIALAFSGPLFVTAMASPLLGEHVGWRRWSAVCLGFVGVLVMVRPTGEAMRWAALLPLCAASMGALRDVVTRLIRMSDSPVAILAFTMAAVALAGFATLPFGWKPVAWEDLLIMAAAGILVGSAQYLVIHAFHIAEASLIIPFKYLTLIWAALFGFMIWGHVPDQWIIAGAVLVVGSGLYIMHRETRAHRRGGG
jgi:drug/metabolite transporter (DMT)-like permease